MTAQERPALIGGGQTTSSALFWAEMKDGEGLRVKPGRAMAPGECKFFFFLRVRGAARDAAGALIAQRKQHEVTRRVERNSRIVNVNC